MLGPAVPQVDGEELAPHPEGARGVGRGRGEGGAAQGAGERGRGEGPAGPGRERESGRERPKEWRDVPASSRSPGPLARCSKGHEGDDGQQVDAAPGGGEHPGDEGDARGCREGAGGGGGCFWLREEKKKRFEKARAPWSRLVA